MVMRGIKTWKLGNDSSGEEIISRDDEGKTMS